VPETSRRLVFCLSALMAFSACPPAFAEGVRAVVNPSVSVRRLSLSSLRAIFAMRARTWPDGTPVRVFVLGDDDPLHRVFCKTVLGVLPYQMRSSWDRLVFSGTGQAPTEVNSQASMRRDVATSPGGIGYLPDSMIDDRVRSLVVEGAPGD
jgi:hypothetical protein